MQFLKLKSNLQNVHPLSRHKVIMLGCFSFLVVTCVLWSFWIETVLAWGFHHCSSCLSLKWVVFFLWWAKNSSYLLACICKRVASRSKKSHQCLWRSNNRKQRIKTVSPWWCPVKGQEALGSSLNARISN